MADGRFDRLRLYLHKLPSSLPYRDINGAERDFTCFAVDEEDDFVKEEGVDAAANRQLEHMLGLRIGPSGTFTLKECGPGIEALAPAAFAPFNPDYRSAQCMISSSH